MPPYALDEPSQRRTKQGQDDYYNVPPAVPAPASDGPAQQEQQGQPHQQQQLEHPQQEVQAQGQEEGECIPGVPEDIVLDIIARAPRAKAFSFRRVSRSWRRAVSSDVIRELRSSRGALEQWLFVLPSFPKGGPFRALDPLMGKWHTLPPIPCSKGPKDSSSTTFHFHLEGFACVAVSGKLLVIGGVQTETRDAGKTVRPEVTSQVWEFDPGAWEWRSAPPMLTPRSWCAAAVLEDRFVCVTGGQSSECFLKTAEVYDAQTREWRAISSMHAARCSHRAAVVGGRLVVIAGELERHDHPAPPAPAPGLPGLRPAPRWLTHAAPVVPQPRGHSRGVVTDLLHHLDQANGVTPAQPWHALGAGAAVPGLHHHHHPLRQQGAGQGGGAAHAAGIAGGHAVAAAPPAPPGNASMEVYDEERDVWRLVPEGWLSGSKVPCPVATVGGSLYAVHHSSVHVWDPANATWRNMGDTPGRDSQNRPFQVAGQGCAEMNGRLVVFGGTRDVWLQRTRLTQQHLSSVYSWDPKRHGPGAGAGTEEQDRMTHVLWDDELQGSGARSSFQHANSAIMMWKELPPLEGSSGHVLASAVVSF